jgi:hypothetical protein
MRFILIWKAHQEIRDCPWFLRTVDIGNGVIVPPARVPVHIEGFVLKDYWTWPIPTASSSWRSAVRESSSRASQWTMWPCSMPLLSSTRYRYRQHYLWECTVHLAGHLSGQCGHAPCHCHQVPGTGKQYLWEDHQAGHLSGQSGHVPCQCQVDLARSSCVMWAPR